MKRARTAESEGAVRFDFDEDMVVRFHHYVTGSWSRMLQFSMPDNVDIEDCYRWYSRHVIMAPEITEIFNRAFKPQIKALRDDLPKYFCQPLLEGDELGIMADVFSDRLEDTFDQIRVHEELAKLSAPVSSLLEVTLSMTLPTLWNGEKYFDRYYPQELTPIMRKSERYLEGRRKWGEALKRAQREGLEFEGPIPAAMRQPGMAACQPRQENWEILLDEVFLLVLCMTGPYIRYARLVCKKWRLASSPRAIVGVLGYGEAFRILSGRATFDELSLRLDSLARMALEEFGKANHSASSETTTTAHAGKWSVTASELREIIQGIDPFYILSWYRDALPKFPGLGKMLEAEVFARFIGTRDDLFASALLGNIIYQRSLSYYDLGWNDDNSAIGYRLVREYLEKYPEAASGHPLPIEDSRESWQVFGGL